MRVIITAGGTGGHIYPALAIIHKLQEKEKKLEILYIGTLDRMESKIIPEQGIPYYGIKMHGLNRKKPFKNFKLINEMHKNIKSVQQKIKEFQPDVVIGVGGYVTFPVIYAAHKCKVKSIIHEQNSIPGLTNKLLSRYASRVCISLPGAKSYFKTKNIVYTGNPRSEEVVHIKAAKKEDYHLSPNKKTVVIVMGSLGSLTVNKKFQEILPKFKNQAYEVLFVTGKDYYEQFQNIRTSNVKIVPFLDNMLGVLKFSDLVVSRAGASMISEITTCGLPSILIPSPYVTNNHQYKNALELEKNGASVIIEEEKLDSTILLQTIDKILNDKENYQKMVAANKYLGVEDSATRIYNEIKKVIKEDEHERDKTMDQRKGNR